MGVLNQNITDRWAIYNADCMEVLAALPDNSIHASIYSPPFGGLYHYSSDDRDLSNSEGALFWEHYGMIITDKFRVTIPGRLTGVHTSVVGRYAIGAELKPSYYEQALRNLAAVDDDRAATAPNEGLFDEAIS